MYHINGETMDYRAAVVYLVNLAADVVSCALSEIADAVRALLASIRPGESRIYQHMTIAREAA